MAKSWSGLRKTLEEDYLCEALKGRVQYFCTHYHGAPDHYGRFCVRVDGKEYVMANPYNEGKVDRVAYQLKQEANVPPRDWNGKTFLYDEENRALEEKAASIMADQNVYESWFLFDAIAAYLSSPISESLASQNPVVRMLAVLDRRVGKRTLRKLAEELPTQPEWLQFFYRLRLNAENIPI